MNQHASPFAGLSPEEIHAGLMAGHFGPRWPDEKLQTQYTGTNGPELVRRAFAFVDILERDGAFKAGWKALDYGCGWGRFLSLLLSKGTAAQLDGCDAWPSTLDIISPLGYQNRIFPVSAALNSGEIPEKTYGFIFSFSVFTHLPGGVFERNVQALLSGLKSGGTLYITVWQEDFLPKDREDLRADLSKDGIAFFERQSDTYGKSVVTPAYVSRFGRARHLGRVGMQHVYAVSG